MKRKHKRAVTELTAQAIERIEENDHYKHIDVKYINEKVAYKLRERRLQLGLKMKDITDCLNLNSNQYSRYERCVDRIPSGVLYKITRILDIKIEEIFK